MRLDLGTLVPAVNGWVLCIDECSDECSICVHLPDWCRCFSDEEKIYVALYLTARKTLDYRIATAMHIFYVRKRIAVRPELLVKLLGEARVELKIPPTLENSPYMWEAVRWRGIAYAQTILDLERFTVIRIEPPKDKKEREKLRVLLEGKRVADTVKLTSIRLVKGCLTILSIGVGLSL